MLWKIYLFNNTRCKRVDGWWISLGLNKYFICIFCVCKIKSMSILYTQSHPISVKQQKHYDVNINCQCVRKCVHQTLKINHEVGTYYVLMVFVFILKSSILFIKDAIILNHRGPLTIVLKKKDLPNVIVTYKLSHL